MIHKRKIIHFSIMIILQGFLFYLFIANRASPTESVIVFAYNLFILLASYHLLDFDFGYSLFQHNGSRTRTFFKTFIKGGLYAFAFALAEFIVFFLFANIYLFPPVLGWKTLFGWCVYLAVQLLIAFSEESFFRFYLYDFLMTFLRKHTIAVLTVSFIFALVHLLANGSGKQFVLAFFFSLFAFRIKRRSENPFFVVSWCHFIYNCLAIFVFWI